MTLMMQANSFSRKVAHAAAAFQVRTVTRQAIKRLKQQQKEITLVSIRQQFENLDRLEEAGFDRKWIDEIIKREIKKCI